MAFLNSISYRAMRERIGAPSLAEVWESRPSLLLSLCAVTLIASIMLGGGTRSGFLSDAVLQLIAIPAFVVALSSLTVLPWSGGNRAAEWGVMLCLAAVILPLVQLVPLPPWIWTRLPHREQITGVFDMLRQPLPWLPISVVPSMTWAALISLMPPLAIFLSVIQLGYHQRRMISLVIVAVGILSAFLGLLQVAQGTASPWRFFVVTNNTEAVGFFANRNHLAALLYSVLMFGAAWAINVGYSASSSGNARRFETAWAVTLVGSFLGLVILIAAEGMTRSRAGLGLMIVALFAALWLAMSDRRRSSTSTPVKLIVGSVIVAVLLTMQFALVRIVARFEDPLQGARIPIAENTIAAAEAYMPFGSGFGTFVTVYPGFEPPQDALDNKYVNHAHDDLLEVILEGGAMSLMMMAGFIIWFFLVATNAWRRPPEDARGIDVLLARAATFIVPLILIHSAVDYPLRTGGIMAVFALACGFLVKPLEFESREIQTRLAPALVISEAEKRRLARLRGVPLPDEEAPVSLPEPTNVEPASEAAEADDDIDVLDLADNPPVDLDELAGLVEPALDPRQSKPASVRTPVQPSLKALDYAVPAPAPQPSAVEPVPTRVAAPDRSGQSMSEMAYTLAQFNQLSNELVARSNDVVQDGNTASDPEGDAEQAALTAAEAAGRRLKILHSIKLVQVPDKATPAERIGSPVPPSAKSGGAKATSRAAGALPATDATERRKQVLRSVERFIQDAGIESGDDKATVDDFDSTDQAPAEPGLPQQDELSPTEPQREAATENIVAEEAAAEGRGSLTTTETLYVDSSDASTADEGRDTEDTAAAIDRDSSGARLPLHTAETESERFAQLRERSDEPADASPVEIHLSSGVTPVEEEWSDESEWPQQWRSDAPEGAVADSPALVAAEHEETEGDVTESVAPVQKPVRQKSPDASAVEQKRKPGPQQKATPASEQKPSRAPTARSAALVRGGGLFTEEPAVPETSRWGEDIEWPDEWKK